MTLAWLPLLAFAALFDVTDIPLGDPEAVVFLAPADADKMADVFVLNGNSLVIYPSAPGQPPFSIVLEDGTSGFDVADIDNDGYAEVLAVHGERLQSYRLVSGSVPSEPQTLFTVHTQLSAPAPRPYPYVMVVKRTDTGANSSQLELALPCETTFELRKLDGTLCASFPIGTDAPRRISYGSPFAVSSVQRPQFGPASSLEAEVSRVVAFEPELPAGLLPAGAQLLTYRRGTLLQAREAGAMGAEARPWFPLKTDGTMTQRALYALAEPDYRDSLIWIRDSKSEDIDITGKNVVVGPQRRYPGTLYVHAEDLPDFNGDGYTDLILWQTPEPATSIDSLTRAVVGQKWPVKLTLHLFAPHKNRFEPLPAAQISLEVPLAWFLSMSAAGPLRHVVLSDFNDDGRTDFGCATDECSWSAWLFGETGMAAKADFSKTFPQPIDSVQFNAPLDSEGHSATGLRSKNSLHVLRPAS